MNNKSNSVLIVEDHPMFRESMAEAITSEIGFNIIGQVADGESAVKFALEHNPDVIIMDLNLPAMSGIEAIAEIMANNPSAHILTLTSSTEEERVLSALQAGTLGYILKDSSRSIFIEGLKEVAAGRQFLTPEVALKLAGSIRHERKTQPVPENLVDKLTGREKEVLHLVGKGLSNKAIAQKMVISESTIRVHFSHMLAKLNLEDRNQAILFSLQHPSD